MAPEFYPVGPESANGRGFWLLSELKTGPDFWGSSLCCDLAGTGVKMGRLYYLVTDGL
jgi:hypothetical protein